jgi:hypothetical protein
MLALVIIIIVAVLISPWISRTIVIPVFFGILGFLLGTLTADTTLAYLPAPEVSEYSYPLPHHIPKTPGNLTLRFAMVHDVIHERFPVHGKDYYRARNQEVEKALATLNVAAKSKEAEEYFRLTDDLAVGLEFLGEHQKAVDLMRGKLEKQKALGYDGRALYSTYANLGTFLILWQLGDRVQDVPTAKKRIGESVEWTHKAIKEYPESHFGREKWQVVLEEFLMAVLDDPQLLLTYDMIGNRLDIQVNPHTAVCFEKYAWLNRPKELRPRTFIIPPIAQGAADYLDHPHADVDTEKYRKYITPVGAENGWTKSVKTEHQKPIPFDEPTLGIIGMWRMGSGANPHFALALGEIMLRVGQRYIAWTAFERAYRMKDHYWPDQRIVDGFGAHCRARQKLIEDSLPKENWQTVAAKFANELAFGQEYQKAYQAYEVKRIGEGTRTDDPNFYDAFDRSRGPIATPVGNEDKAFGKYTRQPPGNTLPGSLLFAGLFAFTAAGIMWLIRLIKVET